MAPPATEEADYVVVGGGSAGCVVAGRLAAAGRSVLLFEAGRRSRNPWVGIPLGTPKLFDDPRVNWCYDTEPEPELNGRRLFQPRGKLLGGTGAINGMAYVRGNRRDFDGWRDAGNPGWGYADVLPFFKASEDNARGADAFHGTGGPMHVADQCLHRTVGSAFVAAAVQSGFPLNPDFNGAEQEGVGHFQWNYRRGSRVNPAAAYLRGYPGLAVRTGAEVDRVNWDGCRATGVRYLSGGQVREARARREVVLCGGTFASPCILQRSGLGPADLLGRHGIPTLADLPGVGANYRDHFTFQVAFESTLQDTINDDIATLGRRLRMGLAYALRRRGPLSHPGTYAGGFIRTRPDLPQPDIELNLNLWTRKYARTGGGLVDRLPGFTMLPLDMRPDFSGTVHIRSADPAAAPEIRANAFRTERDRSTMVRALEILRGIAQKPALAGYVAREITPGPDVHSEAAIIDHIRQHGYTTFHAVGTCRMGTDAAAVVDARLRVRAAEGLRVVDASVMPTIVAGNTNAATMMIAEKGVHMILEDGEERPGAP